MSILRRLRAVSPAAKLRVTARRLVEQVLLRRDIERITFIAGGPVHFQSMRAAARLGLVPFLRERPGATRAEVAAGLGIPEKSAHILLMSCATLKLVRKRGDRYYNRLVPSRMLDPGAEQSAVPNLEFLHRIVYPSFRHYLTALETGEAAGLQAFEGTEDNLYERLQHAPELLEVFHASMDAHTRVTNQAFVELIRFDRFRRVLDVGGSTGANLIRVARQYPSVRGTVLDYPGAVAIARERIAEAGLDARLDAVEADVLESPFPAGHDCVLFCHFTPIFSAEQNRDFVRRAFDALEPGGAVCVYCPFADDDERGPLLSAMLSPYFLCTVSGAGRHYTWAETKAWLRDAGFTDVVAHRVLRAEGVVMGFKPRP